MVSITVKSIVSTGTFKRVTVPYVLANSVSPVKSIVSTGTFKRVTVPYVLANSVSPVHSAASMVVKQLTDVQKNAIGEAYNRKMGVAVVSSPSNQKVLGFIRTKLIVNTIKKSGLEIDPAGTGSLFYTASEQAATNRDAFNALSSQQKELLARQTDYLASISRNETLLATATNTLGITKGQLDLTTSRYEDLSKKYKDLLENPPITPSIPDIFGGLGDFLNKYGLWIALGVGAIILLPSITSIFRSRD